MKIFAKKLVPYAVAVLTGLTLRLCYAPFESSPSLVWVVLAPLFMAVRLCRPAQVAHYAYVGALAFWISALSWFYPMAKSAPMAIVLLGQVALSAWCSLFPALCAYVLAVVWTPWRRLRAVARSEYATMVDAPCGSTEEDSALERLKKCRYKITRLEILGPLAAALLWGGSEYLRATIGGGFAWYTMGVALFKMEPIRQCAALGGLYLVSAAPVAIADAVSGIALRMFDATVHTPGASKRNLDLSVALAIVLALYCWGARDVRVVRRAISESTRSIRVACVDSSAPCIFNDNVAEMNASDKRLIEYSELATRGGADILVWPESAIYDILPNEFVENEYTAFVRKYIRCPILTGGDYLPESERGKETIEYAENVSFLITTNGFDSVHYTKQHLCPFGEYIPLDETLPFLRSLAPTGVSCVAGKGSVRFSIPTASGNVSVAPIICFEDTFAPLAREAARGADLLVTQSNDAWFIGSCEYIQHNIEASFRSIENHIPMIRCSNQGITAVVSPIGEFNNAITGGFFMQPVVLPDAGTTPYSRYGDWIFGIPCAILLVSITIINIRKKYA